VGGSCMEPLLLPCAATSATLSSTACTSCQLQVQALVETALQQVEAVPAPVGLLAGPQHLATSEGCPTQCLWVLELR
jgi:hypothetical protein